MIAQHPRLMGQMDALVRVDDHRWDLRLKDGSLIGCRPREENALMERHASTSTRILGIDLRNPDTVAVRPRANAPLATTPAAPTAAGQ